MIEQRGDPSTGVPLDIHKFAEWILQSVDNCIDTLKDGNYNQFIETRLPIQHRTGTILRKDWWPVFPEIRKKFLSDLSQEDIALFAKYMEETGRENTVTPLKEITANDYFRACVIGYAANHYSGSDRTPREQYYLHADGRDGGLGEIDPNSPSAVLSWFTGQYDGHPWEVVKGGNSTHISLYPQYKEDGFTFLLDGLSVSRTIEIVRFYIALWKAGLPVYIKDGSILAHRLTGNEKIGIVPQGIAPVYCESLFSEERIISFMNLERKKIDEVIQYCTWQSVPPVRLRP